MALGDNARWRSESGDAAKLAMLLEHMSDIEEAMDSPDMSSGPGSVQYGNLNAMLTRLQVEANRLESRLGSSSVQFTRGRPR